MSTLSENEPVSGYVGPSGRNITLHDLADFSKKQNFTTKTASHTLIATDEYHTVVMNVADGNNLTVPANATVAFDIGVVIGIIQLGAGQTTVVAADGVTINSSVGLLLKAQYSVAHLIKTDTNTWILYGDLAAA